MALTSAAEHYRRQQRISALAVRDSRKAKSDVEIAQVVNRYQLAAAADGASSVSEMLAEQDIPDLPVAEVNPQAFMSGGRVAEMAASAATNVAVDRLVATLVQDAGRTASSVATAIRPNVSAYARYLNPPSCSRCAILAGRVYRWSRGFQRHPFCDCVMMPTTADIAPNLITNPMDAFERGQVRGLSQADTQAVLDGTDLAQVVNIRRTAAGLVEGTSVITRGGRLTPQGIYQITNTRAEAVELLRRHGYVVGQPNVTTLRAAKLTDDLSSLSDAELRKSLMSVPADERAPIVAEMQARLSKTAERKLAATQSVAAEQKTGQAWVEALPTKQRDLDIASDLRAANPHYALGPEYQNNCTNAVTAFELRRRGYDVKASAATADALENGGRDLASVYQSWGHPPPRTTDGVSNLTHSQMLEKATGFGEGSRGGITVVWKDGGAGHSFSWEVKEGRMVFYDPQSGRLLGDGAEYLDKAQDRVHIFRMDDLPVTDRLREALWAQ